MIVGVEIPEIRTKFEYSAVQMIREVDNGLEVTLVGGVTFLWPNFTYDKWRDLENKLRLQMKLAGKQ
jgi:hypothetical protein